MNRKELTGRVKRLGRKRKKKRVGLISAIYERPMALPRKLGPRRQGSPPRRALISVSEQPGIRQESSAAPFE